MKLKYLLLLLALASPSHAIDPVAWGHRFESLSARNMIAQATPAATLATVQAQAVQAQASIQSSAPTSTSSTCHTAICFVWNDWQNTQVSGQLLYDPSKKFAFEGGSADVAVAYNPAIGSSVWPNSWTAAGVPPPSCAFLEIGGGGDSQSAFAHIGASCNLAPVIVGAAAKALIQAGGNYSILGEILQADDGSGVKLSYGLKLDFIAKGGFENADQLKGEGVVGIGYLYKFKTPTTSTIK